MELPNIFTEKYPELLKKSELRFGIECYSGWYHLIDGVFSVACRELFDIKRSINRDASQNKPYLEKVYIEKCQELPVFKQIKEKFGTLRMYVNDADPVLNGAILLAEKMSAHICEYCGMPAKTRKVGSWMSTICHPCTIARHGERAVLD